MQGRNLPILRLPGNRQRVSAAIIVSVFLVIIQLHLITPIFER